MSKNDAICLIEDFKNVEIIEFCEKSIHVKFKNEKIYSFVFHSMGDVVNARRSIMSVIDLSNSEGDNSNSILREIVLKIGPKKKKDRIYFRIDGNSQVYSGALRISLTNVYSCIPKNCSLPAYIQSLSVHGVMVDSPFYHFFLDDFLKEDDLEIIESTVVSANFEPRATDLFNFSQTKELKGCTTVYELLKTKYFHQDFISSLEAVCGESLENRFDTSFQKYTQNDYLLTHDDLLENRAFAYVLYLVDREWSLEDGGCLALLDCDHNVNPRNIVERIVPKRNRLAIFQVSQKSFHYVEEVLSQSRNRYSLTGWIYYPKDHERKVPNLDDISVNMNELLELLPTDDSHWEYIQELGLSAYMHTTFSGNPIPHVIEAKQDCQKLLRRWMLIKFTAKDYLLDASLLKSCLGFHVYTTNDNDRIKTNGFMPLWVNQNSTLSLSIIPSCEKESKVYILALYT